MLIKAYEQLTGELVDCFQQFQWIVSKAINCNALAIKKPAKCIKLKLRTLNFQVVCLFVEQTT